MKDVANHNPTWFRRALKRPDIIAPIRTDMTLAYGRTVRAIVRTRGPLALLLLLAVTIVAARYGPEWWGRYLYVSGVRQLQARCLVYSAPPEKIVFDTDWRDRRTLLGQAGYHPFNDWSVFTTPTDWHAFRAPYACPDGTPFLHGRRAASGPERLVGVDTIPAAADVVWLRWAVSDRISFFDIKSLERSRKTSGQTTLRLDGHGRPLRLYAGQIDPKDPAAFTIRGSIGPEPFQIDGRLVADGTVDLRPHLTGAEGAVMAGITCRPAGPLHPGFDPPMSSTACSVGTP